MENRKLEVTILDEREENSEYKVERRSYKFIVFTLVLTVVTIVTWIAFFFVMLPLYRDAQQFGEKIGSGSGTLAGIAVGSFGGVTEGMVSGASDGKEQGLSAEDTEITFVNEMKRVGNLEVLDAKVRIDDIHEYGSRYKAYFVYIADIVFKVDLTKAEITNEDTTITILIPEPTVDSPKIDESESEKIAEWQKNFWSGDAKDGYTAYMNSMSAIAEKAPEEIANYSYLMEQAKELAQKQVKILAEAVSVEDKEISVHFKNRQEE